MNLTLDIEEQVISAALKQIPEEIFRHVQPHIIDGLSVVIRCEAILDNLLSRISPLNGQTNWLRVVKSTKRDSPPSTETLGTEEFIQTFRATPS